MPAATRRNRATTRPRTTRADGENRPRRAAGPQRRTRGRGEEPTAFDLMQRRIVTVDPSTPLSEVARILSENRISGVPVVNNRGKAVGVVSLRDIVDRYVEDPDTQPRPRRTYFRLSTEELLDEDFESVEVPSESEDKAEDVMNPEIVSVPADAGARQVAGTMAKRSVHRVLVTEPETGAVVGIIGSLDVLGALGAPRRIR
jgi:CBS domain-containing protein